MSTCTDSPCKRLSTNIMCKFHILHIQLLWRRQQTEGARTIFTLGRTVKLLKQTEAGPSKCINPFPAARTFVCRMSCAHHLLQEFSVSMHFHSEQSFQNEHLLLTSLHGWSWKIIASMVKSFGEKRVNTAHPPPPFWKIVDTLSNQGFVQHGIMQ